MIETCFFECPDKGKMLTVFFNEKDEINYDFLKQFSESSKIDRYVELIFRNKGKQTSSYLIKQELTNKAVVDEIIDCLVNNKNLKLKIIEED